MKLIQTAATFLPFYTTVDLLASLVTSYKNKGLRSNRLTASLFIKYKKIMPAWCQGKHPTCLRKVPCTQGARRAPSDWQPLYQGIQLRFAHALPTSHTALKSSTRFASSNTCCARWRSIKKSWPPGAALRSASRAYCGRAVLGQQMSVAYISSLIPLGCCPRRALEHRSQETPRGMTSTMVMLRMHRFCCSCIQLGFAVRWT